MELALKFGKIFKIKELFNFLFIYSKSFAITLPEYSKGTENF